MRAADIIRQLGGRMHGNYGLARCPAHEDRSPSLSISEGVGGRILVKCHGGCEQHQVIDALRRLRAWPERDDDPSPLTEAERERRRRQEAEREHDRARRDAFVAHAWQQAWAAAMHARHSPVERWLRYRGIDPGELDLERMPLRWAPLCPMGKEGAPAMVALMTDALTGRPCGIHRTFLLPDGSGKAAVEKPRQMLGSAGVIRLSPDDAVLSGLGISEGIENGAAVIAAGWRPVWAAGSLEAVRLFPVLSGIECLTIFADPKPHEVAGARACASRWMAAGREAIVRIPQDGDWNDALREAA
jgi:hypothetical protein